MTELHQVASGDPRFGSGAIASEPLQFRDFTAWLAMLVTPVLQYCENKPSTVYVNTKR